MVHRLWIIDFAPYTLKLTKCSNCFSSSWRKGNKGSLFQSRHSNPIFSLVHFCLQECFFLNESFPSSFYLAFLMSLCSIWPLFLFVHNYTHRIPVNSGRWHPLCLYVFLKGQRLFRRSGAGSDSFSETSSIGQAEEITRDGRTTPSSSIHPPISQPAPEEDLQSASNVFPEKISESSEQMHKQEEPEVASEERQPEGQEVEQSGR